MKYADWWTDEQRRQWDEWVVSRPPKVRAVVSEYLPDCYRSKKQAKAHYLLHAFEEPEGDEPVTVKVIHGSDSFMPGFMVFGVDPSELTHCGCGKWEEATGEQLVLGAALVDAAKRLRGDAE